MNQRPHYFARLYRRTMSEAYAYAQSEIVAALDGRGACLDCGAGEGARFHLLRELCGLDQGRYRGIEWDTDSVEKAHANGLGVERGDLNERLDYPDESFSCIFGLSVLEHLLRPCSFLKECHRCLEKNGTLVLLTPNISTFFTVFLLLVGKMPSSGPHPDSNALLENEEVIRVRRDSLRPDTEHDTPKHRHLVVFSYRVLRSYLRMIGFNISKGRGFGLYPFPNVTQPLLERIDPYHCHQMVFVARK